jgi:hypothetical protein
MRGLLLVISAFAAGPASAQVAETVVLPEGRPLTVASATNRIDYYRFSAIPGEKRSFSVASAGQVTIEVLDAKGAIVASASGSGRTTVDFLPSFAETHLLAVSRTGVAQPYTLTTKNSAPTLAQAVLAWNVGYRTSETKDTPSLLQCWVTPGIWLRSDYENENWTTSMLSPSTEELITIGANSKAIQTISFRLIDEGLVQTAKIPKEKGYFPLCPLVRAVQARR